MRRVLNRIREHLRVISRLRERMTLPRDVSAGADRAERAVNRLLWERRFERVGMAILVGLYLVGFHTQSDTADRLAKVATTTNDSLCALRNDVARRAENGRQFLKDHPEGFGGIPASAIRVSLDGQERTVRALAPLHCPPERLP